MSQLDQIRVHSGQSLERKFQEMLLLRVGESRYQELYSRLRLKRFKGYVSFCSNKRDDFKVWRAPDNLKPLLETSQEVLGLSTFMFQGARS